MHEKIDVIGVECEPVTDDENEASDPHPSSNTDNINDNENLPLAANTSTTIATSKEPLDKIPIQKTETTERAGDVIEKPIEGYKPKIERDQPSYRSKNGGNRVEPYDRSKRCPFYIKIYCSIGNHNRMSNFSNNRIEGKLIEAYIWKDCKLSEIVDIVKKHVPEACELGKRISVRTIRCEFKTNFYSYHLWGVLPSDAKNRNPRDEFHSSCKLDKSFNIGSCLDVGIFDDNLPK